MASSLLPKSSNDLGQSSSQLVIEINGNPSTNNSIQIHDDNYDQVQQRNIRKEVKTGNWKTALKILRGHMTVEFVTDAVDISTDRTILQFACTQERNKLPTNTIRGMPSCEGFNNDNQTTFMDQGDLEGNLVSQLAPTNANRHVRLLIEMGTDISKPNETGKKEAIQFIYKNMPDLIANLLESNLKLTEDEQNPYKDMYNVTWDLTAVTGVLEHDLVDNPNETTTFESQTLLVSTALQENELRRSEVLLHPLVRLFLHYKHEKCVWLIRASMTYHISWSILRIIYMVHNAPVSVGKPVGGTSTYVAVLQPTTELLDSEETASKWLSPNSLITIALWILTVGNEITEFLACPNRWFYAKQFKNIGQWILLFCVPVTFISTLWQVDGVTNFIAIIRIIVAGLLFLGQLNKTKLLGIYMEMLAKVAKNCVKIIIFFVPLLATFAFLFRLLLPTRSKFGFPFIAKVSTMVTGEIGYDEIFTNEERCAAQHPLLAQSVFLCFVLCFVIMVQNLLICLTLNDIQENERTIF